MTSPPVLLLEAVIMRDVSVVENDDFFSVPDGTLVQGFFVDASGDFCVTWMRNDGGRWHEVPFVAWFVVYADFYSVLGPAPEGATS